MHIIHLVVMSMSVAVATVLRCQNNCGDPDERLVGPTPPPKTRPHPWKIAPFPNPLFIGSCKLGCQLFFSENPTNISCVRACHWAYRYKVTVGYSDLIEEAILECIDGCDIALLTCQTGYYCNGGEMRVCPPGRYRESDTGDAVRTCIDCPVGRYRTLEKGTNADDCKKCPIGKYANVTGATSPDACLRCPAGQVAEEEGMGLCKCITTESCDMTVILDGKSSDYFSNDVDYFRETVPYVGRF